MTFFPRYVSKHKESVSHQCEMTKKKWNKYFVWENENSF